MVRTVQTVLFLIILTISVQSQEIDFGSFSSSYSVTISDLTPANDLEFGIIIQNEGYVSLPISNAKVLAIEGVEYLDVYVDITADEYLLKDANPSCASNPSCRIPFTLQASYANLGNNNISQAIPLTVLGSSASAQFPIKYRGSAPPGPPPTPVYTGYNPALYNETAYLYIYGSINVGSIDAGNYSANITITISYD